MDMSTLIPVDMSTLIRKAEGLRYGALGGCGPPAGLYW